MVLARGADGKLQKHAVVPLEEILPDDMPEKAGLIDRITARMRGWFKDKASAADDEGTSELGGASAAGVGQGFFSVDMAELMKDENTRKARYQTTRKWTRRAPS